MDIFKCELFSFFFFCLKLSHKGSIPVDGQAATPASVSSVDTSFQQGPSDSTTTLEPKVEVKQKVEEDEDEEGMTGGKTGKQYIKAEKKPEVRN